MTKEMNQSVLNIYTGNSIESIKKSMLNTLRNTDILGIDDRLTVLGKVYAISMMTLAKQCLELSLEYDTLNIAYKGRPEKALLAYYKSLGYIGISSEGIGILTVLKAFMLDKLAQYNFFNNRKDACTRYLEAQLTILKEKKGEIISSISSVSRTRYLSNFQEIISQPFIAGEYPELSLEFASAMYDAININIYIALANTFAEDPYKYRSGWPDLTLIKGNEVQFIEVKTTDKLHGSQLVTIPVMRNILPFTFRVCRVIRNQNN
ncbi:MAG: VRR-NUC domain-containing protein [Methylobacter sp.]|nr:VRR-NUC domain-containing protein [Methylobacter sp.]